MAENQSVDEIDLGQLLSLFKKGFNQLGNFFLRRFIFLKKNALVLFGLIILGVAASYVLKSLVVIKLKTEVIVRPNFESKNYLYEVVEEIKANVKSFDEGFMRALEVDQENLKGFKIDIEPIEDDEVKTEDMLAEETKYLEVLQNFKNESFVVDIIKSELSEKSVIDHKITFQYNDAKSGQAIVNKLITYINSNDYFEGLKKVALENAASRIIENDKLIVQIDALISEYSKTLSTNSSNQDAAMVYMEKENLNVPALFSLKNRLNKETEEKKMELIEQNNVISVLNIGKPHEIIKPVFKQNRVLFPSLLLLAFFLFSLFKHINKKSKELPAENE